MDELTSQIVDIAPNVQGPTTDLTLLDQSGLLSRLSEDVGALGD